MPLNTNLREMKSRRAALRLPNQAAIEGARLSAISGFEQSGLSRDRSLQALHKYADLKAPSNTLR